MERLRLPFEAVRAVESLPFAGVGLLGALLASPAPPAWDRLLAAAVGVWLLAAFAFVYNDLQDVERDRLCPRKARRPLARGALRPGTVAGLALALAIAGPGSLAIVSLPAAGLAASTLVLSVLYSQRSFGLKDLPVVSSVLHLVQGALAFSVGAWTTAGPTGWPLWTGLTYGLVFAAGHLHHQAADLEPDRRSGERTLAVRFGPGVALWTGFGLWCLSGLHLGFEGYCGRVPVAVAGVGLAATGLYALAFAAITRGLPNPARLRNLQLTYRWGYLVAGLAMAALAWPVAGR